MSINLWYRLKILKQNIEKSEIKTVPTINDLSLILVTREGIKNGCETELLHIKTNIILDEH